jgi:hypothetical protein
MDGQVFPVFSEEYLEKLSIKKSGSVMKQGQEQHDFSDNEREQLEQQLKNLGYF